MTTEARLMKLLQAPVDQLVVVDRILEGQLPPTAPAVAPVVPVVAEGFIGKLEAAKLLGVKPRTLDRWLKAGRLPFYRVNHSVRLRWSEVQAYLAETCRVARKTR